MSERPRNARQDDDHTSAHSIWIRLTLTLGRLVAGRSALRARTNRSGTEMGTHTSFNILSHLPYYEYHDMVETF